MFPRICILLSIVLFSIVACSSKTKEELYAGGLAEIKSSNPKGAIVFFKNALEKDTNYYEARYELAKAYLAAGLFDLAEKEFQKALAQKPSQVEIKLQLARLHILVNKPGEAKKEIQEYVQGHGETSETLELAGIVSAVQGDPHEAERNLLRSLEADPSKTGVRLELAELYARVSALGKEAEARRLLEKVISSEPRNTRAFQLLAELEIISGHKDKALAIYRKISGIDPTNIAALYKEGLLYVDKGDLDKADQVSAELAGKFPRRPEGSRLKGIIAFRKKNYRDAIPQMQKSIVAGPSPEAYYYLGLCNYYMGALETATSQFRMIFDNNPYSERARFLVALILAKQKRLDDSVAELRKILDANPAMALAHNLLGSVYMSKGMYDEGMKELNRAIELDPSIVDAHLKKGIFYLQRGDLKEAETDFATAVSVSPELLSTRLILATFYIRQNDYAKAMSLLHQGIEGKKSDAVLYNNMAVVMNAESKPAEALEYLQKAKKSDPSYLAASFNIATIYAAGNQTEKALQEYRDVLQKDPSNARALMSLAALLEIEGRDGDAYGYYKKAVETNEGTAYLALANYLMRKKKVDDALSVLDKAIRSIPRNAAALEMKKSILLADKRYREALDVCDDIASINPGQGITDKVNIYIVMKDTPHALEQARRYTILNSRSALGYMMLAVIHENNHELDRAVAEIRKGIQTEPENVQAILMLGNLYTKMKDYKSAMAAYAEALRKSPDSPPVLFAEGALLEEMGKKKEAIAKYREALTKSENYVPALNNLAYLYVTGYGNPREGLRLAFRGYNLEPTNPGIMDTLGYALLKNGRAAEAQKLLEKSSLLLRNDPTVEYHLALALKGNGMPDKAAASLRRSLSLGDFPEAADARKLLEQITW